MGEGETIIRTKNSPAEENFAAMTQVRWFQKGRRQLAANRKYKETIAWLRRKIQLWYSGVTSLIN